MGNKPTTPAELLEKLSGNPLGLSELRELLPSDNNKKQADQLLRDCLDTDDATHTALHIALEHHQPLPILKELLKYQAVIQFCCTQCDATGEVPLHVAVSQAGWYSPTTAVDIVERLVRHYRSALKSRNKDGRMPIQVSLHHLLQRQSPTPPTHIEAHCAVLNWLFENRPEAVDIVDPQTGNTVWHSLALAAALSQKECVTELVGTLATWRAQSMPWQTVTNKQGQTVWDAFQAAISTANDDGSLKQVIDSLSRTMPGWKQSGEEAKRNRNASTPPRDITTASKTFTNHQREPSLDMSQLHMNNPSMVSSSLSFSAGTFTSQRSTPATLREEGIHGSPSKQLHPDLARQFPQNPFDVFLVHAGEQKCLAASTLKSALETAGLRCFLDSDMNDSGGSPVNQMQWALESCRYGVVIVSKSFLEKNAPCSELEYLDRRADWLANQKNWSWRSLKWILYDQSISEFNEAVRNDKVSVLPQDSEFSKKYVMKQWLMGRGRIESWTKLCDDLCAELKEQDDNSDVDHWIEFLQCYASNKLDKDFPRAKNVYD